MKVTILILTLAAVLHTGMAQVTTPPPVDKSPMDMSYCPDQYPLLKFQGKISTPPNARVIYGRPQKDGRTLFGDVIRFNEIWRFGANEATEIEFYKDVKIDGKKLAKGRYTLYCIPTQSNWTIILSKDLDSWGAFKYDIKKDALRVKVNTVTNAVPVEALSMYFTKTNTGNTLTVSWDSVSATLPITF